MPIMVQFEEIGPKLEAGTYEMECIGVREDWLPDPQFGDGHVLKITLTTTDVVDPNGEFIELEAMASFKFTPSAKLTSWLAAFGVPFNPGVEFDIEQVLPGKRCLAKIEVEDRGDKGEWNKVADLMALPRQNATRRATTPGAANEEVEAVYHPVAAKRGEPVTDVRLASEKQIAHVNNLLVDVRMDYAALAAELNLPDLQSQMRYPDVARAVDWLNDRKKALADA